MTHKNTGNGRKISALNAALALSLGLMLSPSHAGQATEAPQAEATHAVSNVLSAKQQTIPLIAVFMATSDMLKLNAALNQGLDAGMTISEAKEILVQLYAYAGFPKSLNALGEGRRFAQAARYPGCTGARPWWRHSRRR
jgi:4-carboxymuconolactone decarboxylase